MSLQVVNNKITGNKLILWFFLFIQFILIVIFMFITGFSNNTNNSEILLEQQGNGNVVKFIEHESNGLQQNGKFKKKIFSQKKFVIENLVNFTEKFQIVNINLDNDIENEFYCFRDGTANTYHNNDLDENDNDTIEIEIIKKNFIKQKLCECNPEWHGEDCGQPEVIWRSFMTSKQLIKLSSPRKKPHKIFYIIQTTGISIETLEIQITELKGIIDLFILCDLDDYRKIKFKNMKTFFIKNHLNNTSGFLYKNIKNRIILFNDKKCTSKFLLDKLKTVLGSDMNSDDIIVYSKSDEILNRKAIEYFKWYDNWPQPVRFRLKYNVYGFYWQHPDNTILGSVLSQLNVLDTIYKSDPEQMYSNKINHDGIVVGDLNHFGGWYCQYCYQPIDIVHKLQYDSTLMKFNYKQIIDSAYIQNLISEGKFINENIQLKKLHRYAEKYYTPNYVNDNSWKFDNININLFASWNDNGDDDEY